jgi:hypothetical protein
MGKLITLPSVQGLCPHKLNTHSAKQLFLGRSDDKLIRSSTVLGIDSFLVEKLLQYIFPKILIFLSIFYHSGKTSGRFEDCGFVDRWGVIHEVHEIESFRKVVNIFGFDFESFSGDVLDRDTNRKWGIGSGRWAQIVFSVCLNDDACRFDFFISSGIRSFLQFVSDLFSKIIDGFLDVSFDNFDKVICYIPEAM